MEILNSNYVPHFTEPSLDDLNKSFKFIEQELEQMIERNFGKIKKN